MKTHPKYAVARVEALTWLLDRGVSRAVAETVLNLIEALSNLHGPGTERGTTGWSIAAALLMLGAGEEATRLAAYMHETYESCHPLLHLEMLVAHL